jgi:hypothetical protein
MTSLVVLIVAENFVTMSDSKGTCMVLGQSEMASSNSTETKDMFLG